MKLTFGKVMTYITITLFLSFIIVFVIDKIEDKRYRESCPQGIDEGVFYLGIKNIPHVVGSKVFALNKYKEEIIDSAVITHSSSGYYYADKKLNTSYNWKIKFKNGQNILITDIKTDLVEYWTSLGRTYRCEIIEWKVDGKIYNSKDDTFITYN